MQDQPSDQLLATLDRLGLIGPGELHSVLPSVRRLAGELPLLDSIWVDALAQSRLLTSYQASEINAGRGERLLVSPYVLLRPLDALGYADCYQARHLADHTIVRLYIAKSNRTGGEITAELTRLVERMRLIDGPGILTLLNVGGDQDRVWIASADATATTVARSMAVNGRFPPIVAIEIASAIVQSLARLESHSIIHGDLSASAVLLDDDGHIYLAHPGLRPVLRKTEGYAHSDLAPSAYDYLAPERVSRGELSTTASDVYAFGCLCWHLLAGRPPLAGGNSLTKLQSAHSPHITDIRQVAPGAPENLTETISRCLAIDVVNRPKSFAAVAEMLGPASKGAKQMLCKLLRQRKQVRTLLGSPRNTTRRGTSVKTRAVVTAGILALLAAACWPAWQRGELLPSVLVAKKAKNAAIAAKKTSSETKPETLTALPEPPKPKELAHRDPEIEKASYWTGDAVAPLILPTDTTLDIEKLSFERGQTVKGENGKRARLSVNGRAWTLASEDVTFENIEFIVEDSRSKGKIAKAAIVISAARAQFIGCMFRGETPTAQRRTALHWRGPTRSSRKSADWNGRLILRDCVVSRLGTAINCPTAEHTTIELTNSLFVACESVIQIDRAPRADEACEFEFDHVTARETGPLISIHYEGLPAVLGQFAITSQASTFAPRKGEPLLLLTGDMPHDPLLAAIEWDGQGSLLTLETTMALRRKIDGTTEMVEDDELPVAGLVRSKVEFQGESLDRAADSQTVNWQVPLQSPEPPGISASPP